MSIPEVFLLNGKYFNVSPLGPPPIAPYASFGGLGGFDEDYDAADLQNLHLAYIPISSPTGLRPTPPEILPSFHRPDLINYMVNTAYGTVWNDTSTPNAPLGLQMLRQAMLRPIGSATRVNGTPILTTVPCAGADRPSELHRQQSGVRRGEWPVGRG